MDVPRRVRLSAVVLVAANLAPLVGVLALGWDVADLLLVYWLESGVVGAWALARLAVVTRWAALLLVPFFMLHFGLFMGLHFQFLLLFFLGGTEAFFQGGFAGLYATAWARLGQVAWVAGVLVLSHGVSFVVNFLGGREGQAATAERIMAVPYLRLVPMHLMIILVGIPVLLTGSALPALIVLVLLKILIDGALHLFEHRAGAAMYQGVLDRFRSSMS